MSAHYLKFDDEADAIAILAAYRGKDDNETDIWLTGSANYALYIVGTIYDGEVAVPGFHVNINGDISEDVALYEIFPNSPSVTWG